MILGNQSIWFDTHLYIFRCDTPHMYICIRYTCIAQHTKTVICICMYLLSFINEINSKLIHNNSMVVIFRCYAYLLNIIVVLLHLSQLFSFQMNIVVFKCYLSVYFSKEVLSYFVIEDILCVSLVKQLKNLRIKRISLEINVYYVY